MKQELRAAFTNSRFWIAFMALLLCFLGFSLPEWIIRSGQGDQMYMDAVSQGFSPIFFGGSILLLPFCATLPYAVSQVEDIRTGFLFLKGIRTKLYHYAANKAVAVALSGAAAAGLACLVHSLLWNILVGPYDPISNPFNAVSFPSGTVYESLILSPYAWRAFLHAIIGFTITGAVWAVVGLAVAAWMPDSLLVVTVPVVFYYFWQRQLLYPLFGIALPSLSGLYNDGQLWNMYYACLIANAAIVSVFLILYCIGLKRRATNA